ncbi:unnamed protein product [Cochlearia groenlandica]
MSSFIRLVSTLAVVVATQFFFLRSVSALNLTNEYLHHKCFPGQGRYMKGSPYDKTLDSVLRDISSANHRGGFDNISNGSDPNAVYVRLQCRGDSYWSKCNPCLATAISGLRRKCSGIKGGIIWYDQCLLGVSTKDNYGKVDYENKFYLSNPNKVSENPVLFNKEMSTFLEMLTSKATSKYNVVRGGGVMVLYAAGEKTIGTKKVYAMVQCTKDLVLSSCDQCLKSIVKEFPKCCDGKQGGRVLSPSCNFRYELYPFLRT